MKTRDGIRLSDILRAVQQAGITVRTGTKHPYMLQKDGLRPCPLAESTDAYRMLTPWLRDATGLDRNSIYENLREGAWAA